MLFRSLIVGLRALVKTALSRLGGWVRPAIIIGSGPNAIACARAVESESLMGLQVVAFVTSENSSNHQDSHIFVFNNRPYPLLNLQAAVNWLSSKSTPSTQVLIALEMGELQPHIGLLGKLSRLTQNMYVVPSIRGLPLVGLEISHFFGQDMVVLWVSNNLARRGPQLIKRIFDVIVSTASLLLLLPLLAALAYWISRTGPVVFSHERIGRGGKAFRCYKFRTMVPDADKVLAETLSSSVQFRAEWEKDFKLKQDPRVTRLGAFLRRTSMDELPQL